MSRVVRKVPEPQPPSRKLHSWASGPDYQVLWSQGLYLAVSLQPWCIHGHLVNACSFSLPSHIDTETHGHRDSHGHRHIHGHTWTQRHTRTHTPIHLSIPEGDGASSYCLKSVYYVDVMAGFPESAGSCFFPLLATLGSLSWCWVEGTGFKVHTWMNWEIEALFRSIFKDLALVEEGRNNVLNH